MKGFQYNEGYYRKLIDLQEKLRQSEEERMKLEEKFNKMKQSKRLEEQIEIENLRHAYSKFLAEDKLRDERNEQILRTLDQIEYKATMLTAKTDRLRHLRRQYENYLQQTVNNSPITYSNDHELKNITSPFTYKTSLDYPPSHSKTSSYNTNEIPKTTYMQTPIHNNEQIVSKPTKYYNNNDIIIKNHNDIILMQYGSKIPSGDTNSFIQKSSGIDTINNQQFNSNTKVDFNNTSSPLMHLNDESTKPEILVPGDNKNQNGSIENTAINNKEFSGIDSTEAAQATSIKPRAAEIDSRFRERKDSEYLTQQINAEKQPEITKNIEDNSDKNMSSEDSSELQTVIENKQSIDPDIQTTNENTSEQLQFNNQEQFENNNERYDQQDDSLNEQNEMVQESNADMNYPNQMTEGYYQNYPENYNDNGEVINNYNENVEGEYYQGNYTENYNGTDNQQYVNYNNSNNEANYNQGDYQENYNQNEYQENYNGTDYENHSQLPYDNTNEEQQNYNQFAEGDQLQYTEVYAQEESQKNENIVPQEYSNYADGDHLEYSKQLSQQFVDYDNTIPEQQYDVYVTSEMAKEKENKKKVEVREDQPSSHHTIVSTPQSQGQPQTSGQSQPTVVVVPQSQGASSGAGVGTGLLAGAAAGALTGMAAGSMMHGGYGYGGPGYGGEISGGEASTNITINQYPSESQNSSTVEQFEPEKIQSDPNYDPSYEQQLNDQYEEQIKKLDDNQNSSSAKSSTSKETTSSGEKTQGESSNGISSVTTNEETSNETSNEETNTTTGTSNEETAEETNNEIVGDYDYEEGPGNNTFDASEYGDDGGGF